MPAVRGAPEHYDTVWAHAVSGGQVAFAGLATAAGLLHVLAEYRGPRWLVYLCKPLTTTSILALALVTTSADGRYRALIVAGLTWSLAGDVFLMLPRDRFVAGLTSFLIAHLCYVAAFATPPIGVVALLYGLLLAALAAPVLVAIWPGLGSLRIPVVAYVTVIVAMAWQAGLRWTVFHTSAAALAALGAALFMASDAALAIDRFAGRYAAARAVVLGTYYPAQLLIALSVRG